MPKTTAIDQARATKRKEAIADLKARPMANEKSVANLRERIALIEEILDA